MSKHRFQAIFENVVRGISVIKKLAIKPIVWFVATFSRVLHFSVCVANKKRMLHFKIGVLHLYSFMSPLPNNADLNTVIFFFDKVIALVVQLQKFPR